MLKTHVGETLKTHVGSTLLLRVPSFRGVKKAPPGTALQIAWSSELGVMPST